MGIDLMVKEGSEGRCRAWLRFKNAGKISIVFVDSFFFRTEVKPFVCFVGIGINPSVLSANTWFGLVLILLQHPPIFFLEIFFFFPCCQPTYLIWAFFLFHEISSFTPPPPPPQTPNQKRETLNRLYSHWTCQTGKKGWYSIQFCTIVWS